MPNLPQKNIVFALIITILLVGTYFIVASLTQEAKEKTPTTYTDSTLTKETSLHIYTDDALHFSIQLPLRVINIEKMGQAIYFKESVNHSLMIVIAEPTPYETTKDWLKAQPKGSVSSTGYELIRWIGDQIDEKALVAEYSGPGKDLKYQKKLRMLIVKNKTLYTVDIDTWHPTDAALTVDSDIGQALETFRATGLVTTNSTGSYRTIQNQSCGATFNIPPDWSDQGILGESKILSPEDVRKNEDWARTHQDLMASEEGDASPGLDARSLYISCQYDFKGIDLKATAVKTIKVNGRNAYELADTNKETSITTYKLILEGAKIIEIDLDQTEYNNLSDTVKQIIQSISFTDF